MAHAHPPAGPGHARLRAGDAGQPGLHRPRGRLRLPCQLAGPAVRCPAQPGRRARPGPGLGRGRARPAARRRPATPMAGAAPRSFRRWPTRCCWSALPARCWAKSLRRFADAARGSRRHRDGGGRHSASLVNLGTAALFHRGQSHRPQPARRLPAPAGRRRVSLAAVLAGLGMLTLGWRWLDPALAACWWRCDRAHQLGACCAPASARPWTRCRRTSTGDEVQAFLPAHAGRGGGAPPAHLADRRRRNRADRARGALAGRRTTTPSSTMAESAGQRFGINHATVQVELGPGCEHDRDDRAPHH